MTGGAPLVESETSSISGVRAGEVVQKLPYNYRGSWDGVVYQFVELIPGAQRDGGVFSLGGTRGRQYQVTLDGTSVNSPLFGNSIGPASTTIDAIEEIKVDLANNKAEYNLPAMLTSTSKSGGNDLHGALFYYHDNGAMNARNTFQQRVPFNIRHDVGGSAGGPIWIPKVYNGKDKTFFFFTFETFPGRSERVSSPNVPTVRMRAGDFSALLPGTVVRDPFTGQPFAGNLIPASMLNAVSTRVQERFYPRPNFGDPNSFVGNWRGAIPGSAFAHNLTGRLDHRVSQANSFFARYTYARRGSQVSDSDLPAVGNRQQNRRAVALTLADTHIISPQIINEFRYGYVFNTNPYGIPPSGAALVSELGLEGLSPTLPPINGMPFFNITGFTAVSTSEPFGYAFESIHNFMNNVTWTKWSHTIKTGIEVRRNMGAAYASNPNGAFGNYSFTGAYSGFAYADFLLGIPQTSSRLNPAPPSTLLNTDWSWFVQDDWKITRKLTLNLGLRYDYNPPYHEKDDVLFLFDPATGRVVVPSQESLQYVNAQFPQNLIPVVTAKEAGYPPSLYNTDKTNFAPRFGFAYRPFATATFVIRGGYGIYIDPFTAALYRSGTGGPFLSSETFTNSITGGRPLFMFPRAFPEGFGTLGAQNFSPIDPNLRNPYIQQWNLTVERELLKMGLRISYMGTQSTQFVWMQNLNQPLPSMTPFRNEMRRFPAIRDVNYQVNGGVSTYHSFHVVAERKYSSGIYYQLGWTWAKNLSDVQTEGEGGGRPQNSYARYLDRGDLPFMSRHRVVGQMLYTLPFGPGKKFLADMRGWQRALAGGWTLSSTLVTRTGLRFSPSFSGFDVSNTNTVGGRPDRIADGNLPAGERTIYRWFDVSAFRVPGDVTGDGRPDMAVGRFGNSAPNVLIGPGSFILNAGVHKDFYLTERARMMLQFTVTNAPNRVNYNNPASNISAPATVGRITSAGAARTGQVGMRIEF
ncbi:MAG: TonB-dependent receptor [Bryobacterales bacterium]|nr:TonB-dependent receptor [Bryobacterales bacterium]